MWPKCPHGYYQTPAQACPWCIDGDVGRYDQVTGPGNGWLLEKGDLTCKRCGGPRNAGYGVSSLSGPGPATPDNVRAALEKIDNCYGCATDARVEDEALAIYVVASREFTDALDMIEECGDSRVLEWLVKLLEHPGSKRTDKELNQLLLGPVKRALAEMLGSEA